jgi:hypothetical protein
LDNNCPIAIHPFELYLFSNLQLPKGPAEEFKLFLRQTLFYLALFEGGGEATRPYYVENELTTKHLPYVSNRAGGWELLIECSVLS